MNHFRGELVFFGIVFAVLLAVDGRCNARVHDGTVSGCEKR